MADTEAVVTKKGGKAKSDVGRRLDRDESVARARKWRQKRWFDEDMVKDRFAETDLNVAKKQTMLNEMSERRNGERVERRKAKEEAERNARMDAAQALRDLANEKANQAEKRLEDLLASAERIKAEVKDLREVASRK